MAPTDAPPRRGRKPKPAALKRDELLRFRVTPLERQAAEARAEAAGLEFSEYARLQLCGAAPEQTASHRQAATTQRRPEDRAPGDLEAITQKVRRENPGIPERSVRILAARRMQQG